MLTETVLEQHAVVGLAGAVLRATAAGVATARRGEARAMNAASLENIVEYLRVLLC